MENICIVSNKVYNINDLYLLSYNNHKKKLVCHQKNIDKLTTFIKIFLKDQTYNFNINELKIKKMEKQYNSDFNQNKYRKFLEYYNISKFNNNILENNIDYNDKVFYRLSLCMCDWF